MFFKRLNKDLDQQQRSFYRMKNLHYNQNGYVGALTLALSLKICIDLFISCSLSGVGTYRLNLEEIYTMEEILRKKLSCIIY